MSTVNTADDVVEQSKIIALSRKAVSQAFWRKEVEKELKEMGWNDLTFNTSSPSWEKALEKIEDRLQDYSSLPTPTLQSGVQSSRLNDVCSCYSNKVFSY